MKKIEFKEQEINVPTDWSEVKLANYEKWYTNKPKDGLSYAQYVADLCGLDIEILLT